MTRPDLRTTPIRDAYTRLVRTVLEARHPHAEDEDGDTPVAELQPGEIAVVLDAGKKGNKNKLVTPWVKENSKKKKDDANDEEAEDDDEDELDTSGPNVAVVPTLLQIVKTEASLNAWKKKCRSNTLGVKQLECAHILSAGRVTLPEKARTHYPGTNCGDTITGVAIPGMDKVWKMAWRNKKLLYGKKNLIAVGGKTLGAEEGDCKRTDTTVEPVCFHPMPPEFYDTITDDFHAKRVFDLVTCDAVFSYVCLCKRIGYIGICFTLEHQQFIEDHIIEKLKVDMADFQHPLFNPSYAAAIGTTNIQSATPPPQAKAKGKAKTVSASAKGKAKGKAKAAAQPTAGDGEADGQLLSDAFSGEEDDGEGIWDPLAD